MTLTDSQYAHTITPRSNRNNNGNRGDKNTTHSVLAEIETLFVTETHGEAKSLMLMPISQFGHL